MWRRCRDASQFTINYDVFCRQSSPITLASFVPFVLMESMCLCSHRWGGEKKDWLREKKGENREEFAFTPSLFKFPLPRPRRKRVGGKRRGENKEGEYGGEEGLIGFLTSIQRRRVCSHCSPAAQPELWKRATTLPLNGERMKDGKRKVRVGEHASWRWRKGGFLNCTLFHTMTCATVFLTCMSGSDVSGERAPLLKKITWPVLPSVDADEAHYHKNPKCQIFF